MHFYCYRVTDKKSSGWKMEISVCSRAGHTQKVKAGGGPSIPHPFAFPSLLPTKTSRTMHPLLNNPFSGGCAFASANSAFPPVAAALRLPAATLPGRSAGSCRRRRLSSARASSDGSDGAVADAVAAEASAVGQSKEGEEGTGAGPGGASAASSAEKQPPPVNPKIEKELKKVGCFSSHWS